MELGSRIVRIARGEVGNMEEGGNNLGQHVGKYQLATWLDIGAWPWCAAFTAWVLKSALKAESISIPRCRDASVRGWEKWAKKHNHLLLNESDYCQPGDFVTFDFSHIGIVVADKKDVIETIEGNTNNKGQRDSQTGDGVWMKERDRTLVKHFIRLKYT